MGRHSWEELYRRARQLLDSLNLDIVCTRLFAIWGWPTAMNRDAKALSQDAGILVLDEPTAALTDTE